MNKNPFVKSKLASLLALIALLPVICFGQITVTIPTNVTTINGGTLSGNTTNTGSINGGVMNPSTLTINGTNTDALYMRDAVYLDASGTNEAIPYADIMSTHPLGTLFSASVVPLVGGSTYLYGSSTTTLQYPMSGTSTVDAATITLSTGSGTQPRAYVGFNTGSQPLRWGSEFYFQSSGTGPDAATLQLIAAPSNMFTGGGFTGTSSIVHFGLGVAAWTWSVGTIGSFVTIASGTYPAPVSTNGFLSNNGTGYLGEIQVSGSVGTFRIAQKSNPASTLYTFSVTDSRLSAAGGNTVVFEPFYNSTLTFDQVYVRQQWASNTVFTNFQNTLDNVRQRISGTAISSNTVSGSSPYFRNLGASQSLLDAQTSIGVNDAMHLGRVFQQTDTFNTTVFSSADEGQATVISKGLVFGDPAATTGKKWYNLSCNAGGVSFDVLNDSFIRTGTNNAIIPIVGTKANGQVLCYSNQFHLIGYQTPVIPGGIATGDIFGIPTYDNLPVMTSNTTSAITFNTGGTNQTIYNPSSSTILTGTIALPSVSVHGQTLTYSTAGAVTTLVITGSQAVSTGVSTLAIGAVIQWQAANTTGLWVQVK